MPHNMDRMKKRSGPENRQSQAVFYLSASKYSIGLNGRNVLIKIRKQNLGFRWKKFTKYIFNKENKYLLWKEFCRGILINTGMSQNYKGFEIILKGA